MILKFVIFFAAFLVVVHAENVGWQSYLDENPTEFHDILLEWEGGDQTPVPSWLSGTFVRNGPAQVHKYIESNFRKMRLAQKYALNKKSTISTNSTNKLLVSM